MLFFCNGKTELTLSSLVFPILSSYLRLTTVLALSWHCLSTVTVYRLRFTNSATDLLGEGEEAAEGQGTVRMALAPEFGLFAEAGIVMHDEE